MPESVPVIPHRSRLFHLPPVGVGTSDCESLTSYIARLASAHMVTTGTLVSKEIAILVSEGWASRAKGRGVGNLYKGSAAINGTGDTASGLVNTLAQLTLRKDLHLLTLQTWSKVLPDRGLLRPYRSWCPACYDQMITKGSIVYDKLLWTLECVSICHLHKVELLSNCVACGAKQRQLDPWYRPGFCSSCDRWLGNPINSPSFLEAGDAKEPDERWQDSHLVGQMIAGSSEVSSKPDRSAISNALNTLVDSVADGNSAAASRLVGIPKNTLWLWCQGKVLPQLQQLLVLAKFAGVALPELLSGTLSTSKMLPRGAKPRRRPGDPLMTVQRVPVDQITNDLRRALLDSTNPASLQAISRRLGYDSQFVRTRFPDLARAISQRYLEHRALLATQRRMSLVTEVSEITRTLHEEGVYPGARQVSARMRSPGTFRERWVRDAWQNVLTELGYWEPSGPELSRPLETPRR